MTDPARAESIVSQLPFVRFGGERAAQFLREAQAAMAASPNAPARRAARKARVLAHPWAAQKLARIIGTDAAKWNGYVPERNDPHTGRESGGRHFPQAEQTWRTNNLPQFVALRQLLAEVAAFEAERSGGADVVQGG